MTPAGLPHSEIPGSQVVCTSPRLIAAYHVLHRFPEPRHPPYALSCLTSISSSPRAQTGPPGAAPSGQALFLPGPTADSLPRGNSSLHARRLETASRFHQLAWCALSKNHRECPALKRLGLPACLTVPALRPLHPGLPGAGPPGSCSILTWLLPYRRPRLPGGEYRARTGDLLLAKQALSQLS
jgi:hypothetical protein